MIRNERNNLYEAGIIVITTMLAASSRYNTTALVSRNSLLEKTQIHSMN